MATEDPPPRAGRTVRVVAASVAAVAVAVPLVVLLVQQFTQLGLTGIPCCDYAVLELGTRSFLRGEQLVGLYSREGWYHPGPASFVWTAPYRLLPGGSFAEHQVGAAVLLALAVGVLVLAMSRRLRLAPLAAGLAVVAVWMARFDIAPAAEPWNPIAAMSWVVLAVVSAAMFASGGSTWWLPVYAVVASAALQTHLGTAGVVAVGLAVVAWSVRQQHTTGERRPGPRWWSVGVAIVVVWLLPLIDLAVGEHNLARIVSTTLTGDGGEAMSPQDVVRAIVQILAVSPSSQSLDFGPASPFLAAEPIGVSSFVLAAVGLGLAGYALATRARHPFAAALTGTALGGLVSTGLLLLVADGPFLRYLAFPVLGLGLLVWVGGAIAVVDDLGRRAPSSRTMVAVGAATIAVLAGVVAVPAPRPAVIEAYSTDVTAELTAAIAAGCAALPERTVVVAPDDEDDWPTIVAVVAAIERCTGVESVGLTGFISGPAYAAPDDAIPNVFVGVPNASAPGGHDIAASGAHVVRLLSPPDG